MKATYTAATGSNARRRWQVVITVAVAIATLVATLLAGALPTSLAAVESSPPADSVKRIAKEAMATYNLRSIIVRVTADDKNVYTGALGESVTGVPAAADMHFCNGAFAFTYSSTMLLELVDQKKVSLDDPLAKYVPDLPDGD